MSEVFELITWTFIRGAEVHRVSAAFDMSEAEARKRLGDKLGFSLDGFSARRSSKGVEVMDPPTLDANGNPVMKKWRVTFERTQTMEIEVEAETEEEARKKARDESSEGDWETEDDGISDVLDLGGAHA